MKVEVTTGIRFDNSVTFRRVPIVVIQVGGIRFVTDAPDEKAAIRMAEQTAKALGISQ